MLYVIEQILFLLPTALSLVAAYLCFQAFSHHRREVDRDILLIGGLAALMLFTIHICNYTSNSGVCYCCHNKNEIGVSQVLWVMYNSLIMIVLIIFARRRKVRNHE